MQEDMDLLILLNGYINTIKNSTATPHVHRQKRRSYDVIK